MDKILWQLIKAYGNWAFQTGVMSGKGYDQQYESFTKYQDDALAKIKRHLSETSTRHDIVVAERKEVVKEAAKVSYKKWQKSGQMKGENMPTLWDAFLEDYNQEIWDWSIREALEAFWHYCQNGHKAVYEWQIQKRRNNIREIKEIG